MVTKHRRKSGRKRLLGPHALGATPLTPEQLEGLKVPATTQGELDEFEFDNILKGQQWAFRSTKSRIPDMLKETYLRELHVKMLGDVWEWAGTWRTEQTNVGVAIGQIQEQLRNVLDDARAWVDYSTYPPEELAIRLHHRVVNVHPFPNGNGRHARLLADILLRKHFKQQRLPWGGASLGNRDPRRGEYIAALQTADAHDYGPLIAFCRSATS